MLGTYRAISVAALLPALTGGVSAGTTPEQVNAQFARDFYASQSSILIIGDSLSHPRGAGTFVTYYEGLIQTLPDQVGLCGFRVSGSTGNTGVNSYIKFAGGSLNQMVGGGISEVQEHIRVGSSSHSPPGYRNEFSVIEGGILPSSSRFAAVGLVNLPGILPRAESWVRDSSIVFRTRFSTSDDDSTLSTLSSAPITDHDGSAGFSTNAFEVGVQTDHLLDTDRFGLDIIDVEFVNPSTSRIGVQFSGDLDTDDAGESGKIVAWCDQILFDKNLAIEGRGVYLDSISIGGYTAKDHYEALDPVVLDDYFTTSPRPYNTLIIWLGQNSEIDEWNGKLLPAWGQRIEGIVDLALQASVDAGISNSPTPILISTPLATGDFPSERFSAMSDALEEIALRRGWGHINLYSLIGVSLDSIDPGFIAGGPHPSDTGAIFLSEYIYSYLDCIRSDFNGDGELDFLDISEFLNLYTAKDPIGDLNGDGEHDFLDISMFINSYHTACP